MNEQIIHLHNKAPLKPAEGSPCNGCGVCCAIEPCPASRLRFGKKDGACPALEWSGEKGRYQCGLLVRPKYYLKWLPGFTEPIASRLMRRWIAAGVGCDCDANAEY